MTGRMILTVVAAVVSLTLLRAAARMQDLSSGGARPHHAPNSIYEIPVKSIDGKSLKLIQYKGNVLMIVNVASKCGFTGQYEGLQKIYQKYQPQGLVVLGFPTNDFGGQEPGSDEEIKTFCSTKYNVTFPMFSKISAVGPDIHPLYKFLSEKESNPKFAGGVTWNFNKFLIDKNGNPIARFDSADAPESAKVIEAIERALKQ